MVLRSAACGPISSKPVKDLYRWGFPTQLASSLRPRCGLRASRHCHLSRRAKWAVRRGCCAGMNSVGRFTAKELSLCLSAADCTE